MVAFNSLVTIIAALGAVSVNAGPCKASTASSSVATPTESSTTPSSTISVSTPSSSSSTSVESTTPGTTPTESSTSQSTTESSTNSLTPSSTPQSTLGTSSESSTESSTPTITPTLSTSESTSASSTPSSTPTSTIPFPPLRTEECGNVGYAGQRSINADAVKVSSEPADDLDECLARCLADQSCATAAFNPVDGTCEVYTGTLNQIGYGFFDDSDWTYYQVGCLLGQRTNLCEMGGWSTSSLAVQTRLQTVANIQSVDACFRQCRDQAKCATAAFNPIEKSCELYEGTPDQAGYYTVDGSYWTFYQMGCLDDEPWYEHHCAKPGWSDDTKLQNRYEVCPALILEECLAKCETSNQCAFAAFNPIEQQCELWTGTLAEAGWHTVANSYWTFYKKSCFGSQTQAA